MEIKRISHHCLSIYLHASDLEELGITYDSMDHRCPQTRLAIQQLLETALAQTGFDPDGHRLLIEAYPVEEDGCLLLFTLADLVSPPDTHKEERVEPTEPTLFLFSDFSQLCAACHALKESLSSALYWQDGSYILALTIKRRQIPLLQEKLKAYGKLAADSSLLLAELQEHKSCLLPDHAVEQLNQYF